MKTQRRWLKSVIAAAATEEVSMPWAARRAANDGAMIAAKVQTNVVAVARPYLTAVAAR